MSDKIFPFDIKHLEKLKENLRHTLAQIEAYRLLVNNTIEIDPITISDGQYTDIAKMIEVMRDNIEGISKWK